MTSFDAFMRIVTDTDMTDVCNLISRMVNLRKIAIRGLVDPDDWPNYDAAAMALNDYPDIFAEMHHLEEAVIRTVDWIDGGLQPADRWPASLMKNNPNLRIITLFGIRVGDNDLSICSELEHLTHLNLGYNCGFTIAGVLSVLRGRPRSTITEFCLWTDEDMVHQIDKEFDEIQAERNVLFSRHKSFISRKVGIDAKYILFSPASGLPMREDAPIC
jgi:hypothetical protein